MNRTHSMFYLLVGVGVAAFLATRAEAAEGQASSYKGWKSFELHNGLIELQIVRDIGGRVIQFKLGDFEFFWVNDQLAGQSPPPTGLGPKGEWLNWGGEKLWPAPQGWGSAEKWPGPPGPVIEGTPHEASVLEAAGAQAALRLTSPKDPSTGIQFSRVIKVSDGSARVSIVSTMTNIDAKPRRWGIWEVTQLSCADRQGPGGYDRNIWAYCPLNPKSIYSKGYKVMFGAADNPAFKPDAENKMMRVHYERQVGKVGLDSMAGWLAVVIGRDGRVFVQRFKTFPEKEYPDGASVEFWLQAPGKFFAAGKENEITDDPLAAPPYMEAEVLSPFASLEPGQSYSFHMDWYATSIGGNYPILDCTDVAVVCERPRLWIGQDGLAIDGGRIGVFHRGKIAVAFLDGQGNELTRTITRMEVSPLEPLIFDFKESSKWGFNFRAPDKARQIVLLVTDMEGKPLGELQRRVIDASIYKQ